MNDASDMIMWSPGVSLEAVEKQVVLKAFRHFRGNKTATANALGIAIRTLDAKLDKYASDSKLEEEKKADERRKSDEFLVRQRGTHRDNINENSYVPIPSQGHVHSPDAGARLESAAYAAQEHAVSMSERPQVQKVLPRQAPQSGARKGR